MKVLITGSSGMLGNTLKKYLEKSGILYDTLDRNELDLSKCSYSELEKKIISKECNYLINCAGIIKQRKKVKFEEYVAVNSLLPHRLSNICESLNIKMFHITTDCIYNGTTGNYSELSKSDVSDDYGLSKLLGEPINCCSIRTSIIGEEESNKLSLLEWVRSNKNSEINGFTNHFWNGLTCLQISKLILEMIQKDIFWNGTRHIFSQIVSKHQLVSMINDIYELNIKINPIEDKNSINRTLVSEYDISIFDIPDLYTQIKETKDFHIDIISKQTVEK